MKCPFCGAPDSRVINSRPSGAGESIRRRRVCEKCGRRFTTFEVVERAAVSVVKRSGVREAFDADKVRAGIQKACEKRPVPAQAIDAIVAEIEGEAFAHVAREIPTDQIGLIILRRLKEIDPVAYLRFASVYKQFRDLTDFNAEIQSLLKE